MKNLLFVAAALGSMVMAAPDASAEAAKRDATACQGGVVSVAQSGGLHLSSFAADQLGVLEFEPSAPWQVRCNTDADRADPPATGPAPLSHASGVPGWGPRGTVRHWSKALHFRQEVPAESVVVASAASRRWNASGATVLAVPDSWIQLGTWYLMPSVLLPQPSGPLDRFGPEAWGLTLVKRF